MQPYQLGEWLIAIDPLRGNVCRMEKNGMRVVEQSAPMFTLAVDGHSARNDQRQMHNIELYDEIGAKSASMLEARLEGETLSLAIDLGEGFSLTSHWTPQADWLRMRMEIGYTGQEPRRLRWLNWRTETGCEALLSRAQPFCPGYTMNLAEPLDLNRPIGAYRHRELLARGLFGDHAPAYRPGFLGLYDPEEAYAVCTWHTSEMFPFYTESWSHAATLRRDGRVHCARWMRAGDRQSLGDFYFGAAKGTRLACVKRFARAFQSYGWERREDVPARRALRICELYVGSKSGRTLFEDYDQVLARLQEIHDLGFNAIEIMPKMPFPSYSVFNLADANATYGSQDGVRRVADAAHALGMKVIADMVFHGPLEYDPALGLPRSPYLDACPGWFMRHESGAYARTYTRSFDLGNPEYQRHIGDCMLSYIETMHVDGFRLDAQMWSETPNWDDRCPRQPYASVLAGMRMMDEIAPRVRAKYPHAFFYTEANGPYAAKGHEYRYNYDTHWLFPALTPIVDPRGGPAATQNLLSQGTLSWPDAARWLEELRATSPKGMTIVFQTDSHDSAEWCGFMGGQYNYEAYGPQMHRVLFALMNFMDGALMSLYGAQKGNEAFYSQLAALCREPIMAQGECDYTGATADDPKSAVVAWRHGSALRVYVGNLENRAKTITLRLPVAKGHYRATERLCGRSSISFAGNQFSLSLQPCDALVWDISIQPS